MVIDEDVKLYRSRYVAAKGAGWYSFGTPTALHSSASST